MTLYIYIYVDWFRPDKLKMADTEAGSGLRFPSKKKKGFITNTNE